MPESSSGAARVGTWASLRAALTSRRIGAVTLQSFSSGLPLGLIWIALPAWLSYRGVDIKTVGFFSLAQAPWTFKFLWAPAMDRWSLGWLGQKRSWMLLFQFLLAGGIALLALEARTPSIAAVAAIAIFIAFCSASQDIAIDGYAVEVLERSELGTAVGARVALYRAATLVAGALAITIGARYGWGLVFVGLGLLFLPLMGVVFWSPEPPPVARAPRTLREAVFEPLVGIFRKTRAAEIIGFLLLYKFGENLATALTRPFLIQKCFVPEDVGLATATIGIVAIIVGTFIGGWSTERIGLGRALWIFGAIQAVGFLGYIAIDRLTPGTPCLSGAGALAAHVQPVGHRLVMYAAVGVENLCQGMATGAFGVLLLRLTQKQFSATQYALFSSIFALGRTLAGPPAGVLVDAIGWTPFFVVSVFASVPGLLLLRRFVPLSAREPDLDVAHEETALAPIGLPLLIVWSLAVSVAAFVVSVLVSAFLAAMKTARALHAGLPYLGELKRLIAPAGVSGWVRLCGLAVVGLTAGAAVAAFLVARRGLRPRRELRSA